MPATAASRLTPYVQELLDPWIGALGAGVALAVSEDLRSSLFGSASHSEPTPEGS